MQISSKRAHSQRVSKLRVSKKTRKRLIAYLLLSPLLILLLMLLVGLLGGIVQSFGYIPEFGLHEFSLRHFLAVLSNENLLASIGQSLYVAIVATIVATILATALSYALVITGHNRGAIFAIIKFPIFFPWMVTALLMIDLFSGGGLLANIFKALDFKAGMGFLNIILYSPTCLGIILAFVWAVTPFMAFFIVTIMANITNTLSQAALNLGASPRKSFFFVTLPLCFPAIKNVALITLVSLFANYEIPLLLGMTTPRALPVEIYAQLETFPIARRPELMALCLIMFAASLLMVTLFYLVFQRKNINLKMPSKRI